MVGMSQPGWYPDPEGSGRPRYWDGGAWAPVVDAPSPARGNRALWLWLAGLVVMALVVGLLIGRPWGGGPGALPTDTNSARPTGSQWDEVEPTETPTADDPNTGGHYVECPHVDEDARQPQGRHYVAGGVHYQAVPRWSDGGAWTIDFASERSGQFVQVASGWVSVTAIGLISKEDFSSDPRTAAHQLSDCMSTHSYYRTLDHREGLEDRAHTTSDGLPGWLIRQNFWNVPDEVVVGDEIVVVVLDAGDPDHLVLFHSQAVIDDDRRKEQVADALESLGRH